MSKAPSREDVIQFWASIALDAHAPASAQADELREVRPTTDSPERRQLRRLHSPTPAAVDAIRGPGRSECPRVKRKRRLVERIIRARRDATDSLELLLKFTGAEELEHPQLDDVRSARSLARARRFIRIYEVALKAISVDPLARFLASRPYPPGRAEILRSDETLRSPRSCVTRVFCNVKSRPCCSQLGSKTVVVCPDWESKH